jgi:nucleotide-binding universal stress UspA family protein
LLRSARCAVAIAPRGLCAREDLQFTMIAVGYDGEPEAADALRLGAALARAAGARVRLRAVLDDRLPYVGRAPKASPLDAERAGVQQMWDEVIEPDVELLRADAEGAASATGAEVVVDVRAGSPPEKLIALSHEVDLLVIGSRRRRGAQLLLGNTGEEVLHNAGCSVIVVPRPRSLTAL